MIATVRLVRIMVVAFLSKKGLKEKIERIIYLDGYCLFISHEVILVSTLGKVTSSTK